MKYIYNDLIFNILKDEEKVNLLVIKNNEILLSQDFKTKTVTNIFLINKIKEYELLNLLSSNFIESNPHYIKIKIFQIKYNLKKIIERNYKVNPEYKDLINLNNITNLLDEIQYKYSSISYKEYLNDIEYNKYIKKLYKMINIFISFLIKDNKEKEIAELNSKIYFYKNSKTKYINLKTKQIQKLEKTIMHKDFINYKLYKNFLKYENIYFMDIKNKIITYKYDKTNNIYIIYYYNFNIKEINFIKHLHNNKYFNVNNLFNVNIDFNKNNTKFILLKTIHPHRLFLEQMLLEKEINIEEQTNYKEEKSKYKKVNIVCEKNSDENITEIKEKLNDIYIYDDFDKEIEEKLFF